ncbi:hypothetical protein HOE04_02395 [archaeon]|jgi:sugar-specific transcriptional regulator TrmB|nr:hypothetical protein [archaeon]
MYNPKIVKVLEKLGFSPNEIKVYLILNRLGSAKAGKISKTSEIDRSSCYNSLKSLIEKGFVSYVTIGKIKRFQVSDPARFIEYIKEQEEDIKSMLPELIERRKKGVLEGQVKLFKGIRGIKSIYMDIIETGKNNYVFGSEGQFVEEMPEFALIHNRLKKEKGIKTKVIIREGKFEKCMTQGTYRWMSNVESSPAITDIYGDKVAIIIYTDEPEGVVIENAAVARAYKSYFDKLWDIASEEGELKKES